MVDEDALYRALTTGIIAGAGLDVHFNEPRAAGDKYAKLTNVVFTPHIAAGSRKGVFDEVAGILGNCQAAIAGETIKYQVRG